MYFRARSRRMTVLTASAPGGVLTGGQCWTHGSCSEMLKKKNLFLLLLLNDEVLQFSQDSIVYQFSSDNMWAAYYGVIVQLFTKVSERSPQTDKRKEQDFYIEQQTSAARFSVKVLYFNCCFVWICHSHYWSYSRDFLPWLCWNLSNWSSRTFSQHANLPEHTCKMQPLAVSLPQLASELWAKKVWL